MRIRKPLLKYFCSVQEVLYDIVPFQSRNNVETHVLCNNTKAQGKACRRYAKTWKKLST